MLHCVLLLSPFQSALASCTAFRYSLLSSLHWYVALPFVTLLSSLHSYVALSFATLSVPVCTRMLHCLLLLSPFQSALVCCTAFCYSPVCTRMLHCLLLLSPFQSALVCCTVFCYSLRSSIYLQIFNACWPPYEIPSV